MQIKKKIMMVRFLTFIFFIICSFCCTNQKDSNDFWIHDYNLKELVKVPNEDVIHIKNNIYKYSGRLYLSITHFEKKLNNKGQIINVNVGNYLSDSLDNKPIKSVIDLDSYKELEKDGYIHMDKNNLYISQLEKGCYHCIKVLNVNISKLKILDSLYSYATDGNKVYCLRYGEEIKTKYPKTFQTIELSGLSYGIDSTSIYSMCKPLTPSDFIKYYNNIEYKVRDSIVKKYFD